MRVFLRYAHLRGLLDVDLSPQVAMPRIYAMERLPRFVDVRYVAARDPTRLGLGQRVIGIPLKRAPTPSVDYLERRIDDGRRGAVTCREGAGGTPRL